MKTNWFWIEGGQPAVHSTEEGNLLKRSCCDCSETRFDLENSRTRLFHQDDLPIIIIPAKSGGQSQL